MSRSSSRHNSKGVGEDSEKNQGAPKLSLEMEAQLKEAFAVFDVGGDGKIDANELQMVLDACDRKMTIEEVQKLIATVDDDEGGEIELPEFLKLMSEQMSDKAQDEELIEAFKSFGVNDENQLISKEMLDGYLRANDEVFKQEDLDLIFDEIAGASKKPIIGQSHTDADNAGGAAQKEGISFKDFMLMMMAK